MRPMLVEDHQWNREVGSELEKKKSTLCLLTDAAAPPTLSYSVVRPESWTVQSTPYSSTSCPSSEEVGLAHGLADVSFIKGELSSFFFVRITLHSLHHLPLVELNTRAVQFGPIAKYGRTVRCCCSWKWPSSVTVLNISQVGGVSTSYENTFMFFSWFISDSAWGSDRTNCVDSSNNIVNPQHESTTSNTMPHSFACSEKQSGTAVFQICRCQTIQDQMGGTPCDSLPLPHPSLPFPLSPFLESERKRAKQARQEWPGWQLFPFPCPYLSASLSLSLSLSLPLSLPLSLSPYLYIYLSLYT